MACKNPRKGYFVGYHRNNKGLLVKTIVWQEEKARELLGDGYETALIELPCGHCFNCLMAARKEKALRLENEMFMNQDNCFVTLTYAPEYLPLTEDGTPTLSIRDYQLFMMRLRKHLGASGVKIRYFIAGEYGKRGNRPHYHLIIFGWKPDDIEIWSRKGGYNVYRSKLIEKCWTKGYSLVGVDCGPGVAKYCAAYVTKKFEQKECGSALPQFTKGSLQGGLGKSYVMKYHSQIASQGYIGTMTKHGGLIKHSIPKYYMQLIQKNWPEEYEQLLEVKKNYATALREMEGNMSESEYKDKVLNDYQHEVFDKVLCDREVRSCEDPEQMMPGDSIAEYRDWLPYDTEIVVDRVGDQYTLKEVSKLHGADELMPGNVIEVDLGKRYKCSREDIDKKEKYLKDMEIQRVNIIENENKLKEFEKFMNL